MEVGQIFQPFAAPLGILIQALSGCYVSKGLIDIIGQKSVVNPAMGVLLFIYNVKFISCDF